MAISTREQFLNAAEMLFAERGFYGVSIANIAEELGLTKQALLHHFTNKEKLYGEVLQRISDDFEGRRRAIENQGGDHKEQLKTFLLSFIAKTEKDDARTRLLMRELLDNKRRATDAGAWYLKPFLENLIEMARTNPAWRETSKDEALALIYQLLGALNYYGVSGPTLRAIFGDEVIIKVDSCFAAQFEALFEAALNAPPKQKRL